MASRSPQRAGGPPSQQQPALQQRPGGYERRDSASTTTTTSSIGSPRLAKKPLPDEKETYPNYYDSYEPPKDPHPSSRVPLPTQGNGSLPVKQPLPATAALPSQQQQRVPTQQQPRVRQTSGSNQLPHLNGGSRGGGYTNPPPQSNGGRPVTARGPAQPTSGFNTTQVAANSRYPQQQLQQAQQQQQHGRPLSYTNASARAEEMLSYADSAERHRQSRRSSRSNNDQSAAMTTQSIKASANGAANGGPPRQAAQPVSPISPQQPVGTNTTQYRNEPSATRNGLPGTVSAPDLVKRLPTPNVPQTVLQPLSAKVGEYSAQMKEYTEQVHRLDDQIAALEAKRQEAEHKYVEAKGKHDDYQRQYSDVERALRGEFSAPPTRNGVDGGGSVRTMTPVTAGGGHGGHVGGPLGQAREMRRMHNNVDNMNGQIGHQQPVHESMGLRNHESRSEAELASGGGRNGYGRYQEKSPKEPGLRERLRTSLFGGG